MQSRASRLQTPRPPADAMAPPAWTEKRPLRPREVGSLRASLQGSFHVLRLVSSGESSVCSWSVRPAGPLTAWSPVVRRGFDT